MVWRVPLAIPPCHGKALMQSAGYEYYVHIKYICKCRAIERSALPYIYIVFIHIYVYIDGHWTLERVK